MKRKTFQNLKTGDIVFSKASKNERLILDSHKGTDKKTSAIFLEKVKGNGQTVYLIGDRSFFREFYIQAKKENLFKKIILKIKNMRK